MKKLLLFDIDFTLVNTMEAHDRAYRTVTSELFGFETDIWGQKNAGASLVHLIERLARENGASEDAIIERRNSIIPRFVDVFSRHSRSVTVNVGVLNILESLEKRDDIVLGVFSGNCTGVADRILKDTGLGRFFEVSAFSDETGTGSREDLICLAIRRAEEEHGEFGRKDIFVFDDSVRGVRAAQNLGLNVIAVGTGMVYEKENQLRSLNPTFYFDDFRDYRKVLEIF